MTTPALANITPAAFLAHHVALMAARLADMLSDTPMSDEHPVASGITFLRSYARAASLRDVPFENDEDAEVQPLDRLVAAFGLSTLEIELLIVAGMAEEHEGFASVFRTLHPRGEPRPTAGLVALLLAPSPAERHELRESLLSRGTAISQIVSLTGDAPFFERTLQLPEGLWPALAGVNVWPAGLASIEVAVERNDYAEWLEGARVALARSSVAAGEPTLIVIGSDDRKAALNRAVALILEAERVPDVVSLNSVVYGERLEFLLALHAAVRGVVLVVLLPPHNESSHAEIPQFSSSPVPVVVCAPTGAIAAPFARPSLTLVVERSSPSVRNRAWQREMPELLRHSAHLGARYALDPAEIRDVARETRDRVSALDRELTVNDVAASIQSRGDQILPRGVRLVHPVACWEQLVLSPDRTLLLRESLDRLMHQGRVLDEWGFLERRPGARGVRMLFAGPPGTGKTLAAEVLAKTIGVDLLVVDISRLVSKWIGETEKNLSDVFDAAERSQAVLLFDEADALFGKRTDVSDAHDRYANLETAYLLARLERFDGLAILSTNLRNNIDSAFIRRLEFVVDFDEPSFEERTEIWRCHLPASAPLAPDVEITELASLYPIVGGLIRNASVAAGFTASAADSVITRTDLVRAIRREYEKSGRAFPGAPAGTLTA